MSSAIRLIWIKMNLKNKSVSFLILYSSLFLYSLSGICTKFASRQEFLSARYIVFYAFAVAILGVYAVLWQQVLKRFPLSVAMANKPLVILLSFLWAVVLFKEALSVKTVIGAALMICGVVLVSGGGDK